MPIEIKVPLLPESVADAVVAKWYKKVGDSVARDENLVDLETDKVMLEVPAPKSGVIEKIIVTEGTVVKANALLAIIKEGEVGAQATTQA
ncbi:MAG: dihydrolipoyllysine-residue succinyltransferase, E2 component of oxoglutarate dehydrogenase (succinyl-transferring) complex, partial [uncultured bacterium]